MWCYMCTHVTLLVHVTGVGEYGGETCTARELLLVTCPLIWAGTYTEWRKNCSQWFPHNRQFKLVFSEFSPAQVNSTHEHPTTITPHSHSYAYPINSLTTTTEGVNCCQQRPIPTHADLVRLWGNCWYSPNSGGLLLSPHNLPQGAHLIHWTNF